ncbi:hypothetical protein AGOR_G00108850 [Albula goreensis]|uniref:Osteoclast-stimulating factor 1 n=1 Tax=Albula goreensis TaxID=1534307 RepID=A0A8T3DFT5_9TELE|nr:hypothetical protein AGOR_G00108850 [Albula goreensis]
MNGGRAMWAITPEERGKHDKQFDSLSPVSGHVTGDQARKFFLLSGLPAPVLAQIWALADLNKDGKMDRLEFSIAMKLIKLKLQGQNLPSALPLIMKQSPVMPAALSSSGSPAVAKALPPGVAPAMAPGVTTSMAPGVAPAMAPGMSTAVPSARYAPPISNSFSPPLGLAGSEMTKTQSMLELGSNSSSSMSTASLASNSPQAGTVDWAVPQAYRLKYRQLFNVLDKQMTGFLSGPQVRSALTASNLTQVQLATIWNLADVDKDGRLMAEEFILAMHLVDMAKMGLPLPISLPVNLIPPSLREAEADLLQKAVGNVTFEDKRKENFDRGHAELEKRRQALQEQQKREEELRIQKAREEQERREREAREELMKRQLEQERRLERQREIERHKEEERRREQERKEAAKRELERQRKLEWERMRRQELLSQRNQEQEDIVRLKAKKRSLELELEAVGDKHKQISDRLREVQSKKKIQKGELDLFNQRRERRVNEINALQLQFEDYQKKLSQLVPEQQKLSERLRNMGLSNLPSSTMTMLKRSVSEKDSVCRQLREQLEALEKETRSKLSEMDQNNSDITELRESQRKQQSALDKLYAIREEKLRELEKQKERELENRKREEEEAERQAKLEEERRKRLQEEHEAALREEEERHRQEKLRKEEEERRREEEESQRKEKLQREEEDRQRREQLRREEEERERQEQLKREEEEQEHEQKRKEQLLKEEEEERLRREKQREEEERLGQEKLRREEEERKREEEHRRRLQEEQNEEERQKKEKLRQEEEREAKRKAEEDRKNQALLQAEKEQEEQRRRAAEEDRKQEQQRVADELKRKQEEQREKERREQEKERQRKEEESREEERRRMQQEEEATAKQKEETVSQPQPAQTSAKTSIKGKVAALLKGLEERKGAKREASKGQRKSAGVTTYGALYSFTARSAEELSFEANDLIEVDETKEGEKGWLYGSLRGSVGWFPVSYVEKKNKTVALPAAKQTLAPPLMSSIASSSKPEEESSLPKMSQSVPRSVVQNSAPVPTPVPAPAEQVQVQKVATLQAKAQCSWAGEMDGHLSFSKDDVIAVLEQQEEWWLGELHGSQGWFPASYVTMVTADGVHTDQPNPSVEGPDMLDAAQQEEYVALYTYDSPELGDLIFNEGDTIMVMEKGGDWWKGSIGDRTGVFPSNYVKPKETETSSKQTRPGAPSKKPEIAQVTMAYTATGEEQLTLAPGQVILLINKTPTGWWLGELQARGKKRQKGWFPASHVKLLGSSEGKSAPAPGPNLLCKVVALYDYQAANQDEISFSSGQLINVLDKSDPDWWKGEFNGVTGLFPSNYVEISSDSAPTQQRSADVDTMSTKEKKRQDYIQELIESEERHLEDLQLAWEVFYKLMSESGRMTEAEISMIFLNWKELIVSSTKLLRALQERKKESPENVPVAMIGDVLASELSDMQAYIHFCTCQLKGAAMLQRKTDQEPEFKEFLKKIATDYRCKGMPLSSFMLKPMQRITRYPLIIKNILESTPETHVDYVQLRGALERAEELCLQVNEGVREKENADRLEWLQSHIQCDGITENLVFNSLTNCLGPRKLLHSGKVHNKSKGNKEMYTFLFNDFLLLTYTAKQFSSSGVDKLFSPKCNMQFKMYKMPLFLNEVLVKLPPDSSSEESVFHISHINRVYTLKTESINERTAWVQKIKAASEEFLETEKKKRDKTFQGRSPNGSGNGRLLVTILEATELKSCKPNGKGNPYCEVTIGEQCYTSRTLNDTLNPKWNFNCQFFIKDLYQDVLCITILERDPFSPDGFLGRTEVPLATIKKELENKGPANRRLLLHEVPTGEVWVQLDLQLFDQKSTT